MTSAFGKAQLIHMQAENRAARRRKAVGNALMLGGIGLLAAFFGFKIWSAQQSTAGIDAFEAARAVAVREPATLPSDAHSPSVSEAARVSWDMPADTSSWSAQRIAHYQDARDTSDAPPQAILNIDHLNIRVPVFNGATDLNLNRGVARIIGTGRIGEAGNLGIAGHRDGFFRPLKDIRLGDRMTLETHFGTEVFEVSSIEIVDPTELDVLAPTDAATVTLVTCYPFYHVGNAPKRFIVKAEALIDQVNS
jgi:sortase A